MNNNYYEKIATNSKQRYYNLEGFKNNFYHLHIVQVSICHPHVSCLASEKKMINIHHL